MNQVRMKGCQADTEALALANNLVELVCWVSERKVDAIRPLENDVGFVRKSMVRSSFKDCVNIPTQELFDLVSRYGDMRLP